MQSVRSRERTDRLTVGGEGDNNKKGTVRVPLKEGIFFKRARYLDFFKEGY